MVPFSINIPDSDIEDLRHRLRQTLWPDAPPFVMDSQVRGTQVVAGKVKTTLQFLTVETPKAYENYLIQIFYDSFAA